MVDEEVEIFSDDGDEDDISSAEEEAMLARAYAPLEDINMPSKYGCSDRVIAVAPSQADGRIEPSDVFPLPPSGLGMARLLGHLRCDNLKLQEDLNNTQKLLEEERAERYLLSRKLEKYEVDKENAAQAPLDPCESKLNLERELISCKMKFAAAVEMAENLETLKLHYESELAKLCPNFEPFSLEDLENSRDLSFMIQTHPTVLDATGFSDSSKAGASRKGRKSSMSKLIGRVFKQHATPPRKASVQVAAQSINGDDASTQREVISCLMAELEKMTRKNHCLVAKLAKRAKLNSS